jgi:hypothetical protein
MKVVRASELRASRRPTTCRGRLPGVDPRKSVDVEVILASELPPLAAEGPAKAGCRASAHGVQTMVLSKQASARRKSVAGRRPAGCREESFSTIRKQLFYAKYLNTLMRKLLMKIYLSVSCCMVMKLGVCKE